MSDDNTMCNVVAGSGDACACVAYQGAGQLSTHQIRICGPMLSLVALTSAVSSAGVGVDGTGAVAEGLCAVQFVEPLDDDSGGHCPFDLVGWCPCWSSTPQDNIWSLTTLL